MGKGIRQGRVNIDPSLFIGKKYGKLTVIAMGEVPLGKRRRLWLCHCDCGKDIWVPLCRCTKKVIKSCGCSRYRPPGESGLLRIFNAYRTDAKKKEKKIFQITFDDFKKLTSEKCFYCGIPPSHKIVQKSRDGKSTTFYNNGIDRIDSSKGYILNNIVPCCTLCNMIKWTLSKEAFLYHIKKIISYQEEKPRIDVDAEECTVAQVHYKVEEK